MLSAICGIASAQKVSIDDIEIKPGESASAVIQVTVGDQIFSGIEFTGLKMPEGLTLVEGGFHGNTEWDPTAYCDWGLQDDGTINGSFTSMKDNDIPSEDGYELGTIEIEAASDLEVGTVIPITFAANTILFNPGSHPVVDEVTFNVKIVDAYTVVFDENSDKLPRYTDGSTANVTMTRTIKAGEWSTIVLPFQLNQTQAKAAFGNDVQLAEFEGFVVDYGEDEENVIPLGITINLKAYTLGVKKPMTGGKPFLIKTSKDITSIDANDVKLVSAVSDVNIKDEFETDGKLTGTFVKTTIPADGLFLNGGQFWYSTGKTDVKAFRCWFELGAVLDKETAFARVKLNFGDSEATGVNEVMGGQLDGEYYNLNGVRVETPSKGIYIKDGKKVVVK